MMKSRGISVLVGALVFLVCWGVDVNISTSLVLKSMPDARAADKPFYEGKTVNIIVPSEPGGGYDLYARLVSRHMGKYLPGKPRFIIQNMDGGGGLTAANHLYNRVRRDGLTLMIFNHINIIRQLVGDPRVLLDVRKMKWIGTASGSSNICIVRNDARYKRIEEIIGAKEPVILGATPADSREYYPKFLNEVLGTNLKIITGYKSGGAIYVAVETGEVQGLCGINLESLQVNRPLWLKDKFVSIFLQLNPVEKIPDLPDVPWIMDYVKNLADRQLIEGGMGTQAIVRSFVAPPGVPDDRIEVLRKAFMATMKDKNFLAEAAKTNNVVSPRTGPEVEAFIKKWFSLPKESVDKIRNIYFPAGF